MGRRNKKQSNSSYKFAQTKCGVTRLRSEFRNNHEYLASISRLLKHVELIMMKSEIDNVVSDDLCQQNMHAIIEQVEEMLRTTCHTVLKALVKFTHIG